MAREINEEFNSPQLDLNRWKTATAGKALFKIDKGKLILTSNNVADGIFLYYIRNMGKEDIIIEVTLNPTGIKNAGAVGFTTKRLTLTVNTDINPQFIATFMHLWEETCRVLFNG